MRTVTENQKTTVGSQTYRRLKKRFQIPVEHNFSKLVHEWLVMDNQKHLQVKQSCVQVRYNLLFDGGQSPPGNCFLFQETHFSATK